MFINEVINLILSLENKEQIFENLSSLLIILNNNYFKLTFTAKKNLLDKIFQTINNNQNKFIKNKILLEKINNMLQILIENKNN